MFLRTCTLNQRSTASHIADNLFTWTNGGDITFGYGSKHRLQFVTTQENGSSEPDQPVNSELALSNRRTSVVQAGLINLNGLRVLVIITEDNVQFHDITQNAILRTYIGDHVTKASKRKHVLPIAKGICSINDKIYVGSIDGTILAFEVNSTLSQVSFSEKLAAHSLPITAISSNKSHLISGDIKGNIALLDASQKQVCLRFDGFNEFPCTGAAILNDLMVTAYGSGHIRVFSISRKRLLSEVAAHSHWINALDLSVKSSNLLSVSDDTCFRIWKLSQQYPWVSLQ
ncbi:WD repeat-containing protein 54 [Halotydeus destructor]|nr:WD repeat-containing protein 54 [Halotydeus destructor]